MSRPLTFNHCPNQP